MFENILIGLFGLLMVNYLVIIVRQRIVKIVIGILGNCFFGLSLFSDYIALPSYMIDLKYILIIILCVACVFSLWRHNRSGKITAGDKRRYDTFTGRITYCNSSYIFPSFMWCCISYTLFWLILIFFLIDFYILIMFSK